MVEYTGYSQILAFDPGATRAGWACLGYEYPGGVWYVDSGVVRNPRLAPQKFQPYKMELIQIWADKCYDLFEEFKPSVVVSEIVPSRGGGIPEQFYLSNTMITTVHTYAYLEGIPTRQVAATKVQAEIGIRGKSKRVTKPQVRNGVLATLPELEPRRKDWIKEFEEPDALAIALYFVHHPKE